MEQNSKPSREKKGLRQKLPRTWSLIKRMENQKGILHIESEELKKSRKKKRHERGKLRPPRKQIHLMSVGTTTTRGGKRRN